MPDTQQDVLTTACYPPFEVSVYTGEGVLDNPLWKNATERLVKRLPDWLVAFCNMLKQAEVDVPDAEAVMIDVTLVTNDKIQEANLEFRQKDSATDVLSFPTLPAEALPPINLPETHLGDILICIEWAHEEIKTPSIREQYACRLQNTDSENRDTENGNTDDSAVLDILDQYVVERLTHGCLHILGHHHDTMKDYNRVVALQTQVLDELFKNPS
ncbi:MAG: rRNA maturation RNase YbeY [Vampirovibrio sp.]|nr:rRNA maturation RNase YbeY [Vampirovibrio sp.]